MSTSKQLKPGSDFSIVLNYKGFEKPGALLEKGRTDGGKLAIFPMKIFTLQNRMIDPMKTM